MIVTALIMGVSMKDDKSMSDAEIRLRAMALGMVEGDSRTLADIQASQQSEQSPSDIAEPTQTPEATVTPGPTPEAVPTVEPTPTFTPTPTPDPVEMMYPPLPRVTPKPSETDPVDFPDMPLASAEESISASTTEPPESVSFVIHSGQSSYGVSKALVEAGLVEDALDFDQYLEDNGYSKRISTGTYEIPLDATEEEIARIITRSR